VSALIDILVEVFCAVARAAPAAIPVGAAIGIMFGPLRLAGVDYSKWFSDPGEINEGADHTWIGMMKWTALNSGRLLLGMILAIAILGLLWQNTACRLFDCVCIPWRVDGAPFGFLALLGAAGWRSIPGLLVGIVAAQGAVEIAWRWGLRYSEPRADDTPLARPRTAQLTPRPPAVPHPGRRRLIICCDGTWNFPGQSHETNVVLLLRAIRPVSLGGISQLVHYHVGVGTGNFLDRWVGGGAGVGLSNSVKTCYGFLVDNYRPGDEILLFGFSRGAYVVRSVAGMVGVVGLLRKNEMHRFYEAWDYYALGTARRGDGLLDAIAPHRYRNVEISCLGVWDTVGALGIPGTRICAQAYGFHETQLGSHVRHAFQGLGLDERRGNFQPAVWAPTHADPGQILKQVWFPGVHSNVGGGYDQHGLADTALLWLLSQVEHYDLLDFDIDAITSAIARCEAEFYAEGALQDSRNLFWKAVACPVPRPVCITDDSEKIHASAFDRHDLAPRGDPYASTGRNDWLLARGHRRWNRVPFEETHAFPGPTPGRRLTRIYFAQRSFCDRMVRRMFGAI
jgi:hypothetical protein